MSQPPRRVELRKGDVGAEVDAEFDFHVEMRTRELMERGHTPDEARAEALRRFGNMQRVTDTCRAIGESREKEMARTEYLDELRQDVRHAFVQLRRAPAFSVIAIGILALGIGATTAIFSAVHAVVLRPLPYHEPERLVRVYATSPTTTQSDEASPKQFVAWHRENQSFERIAPIETRSFTLDDGELLPQQVSAVRTTSDYFPMLGVAPMLGRTFVAEEDTPGRNGVVVLSHRFWQSRFGGDRSVVGRTIHLHATPHTIVGVMPPRFDAGAGETDLWTPIAFTPEQAATVDMGYLDVIARLRPGTSITRAQEQMTALSRQLAQTREEAQRGVRLVPWLDDVVGAYKGRLLILLGAVGLVLVIACVNVANLLLARGVARTKEMSIRAALGARRGRVIRQLLTESLVLGAAGGAAGIAVAYWGLQALKGAAPDGVPRLEQTTLDGTALAFAVVVAVLSSVLFGLVPALRAATPDLQATLKEGGRSSAGVTRDRVRHALVAAEVALSLVLLVGAGLLIRSAILLQRVDPGLDPSQVWSGWVTLPATEYATPERVTQTFERIVEGVGTLPGVESAAAISVAPFTGIRALGLFIPEGRPLDRENSLLGNIRLVTPGLFGALRIPVREGRDFTLQDERDAPPVAIVNEAFAQLAWPGERVIGKRLYGAGGGNGTGPVAREIIGVVGATHEDGLREERRPAVYYPIRQLPPILWEAVQNSMFLVARTGVDPLTITKSVQETVSAIDRAVPVNGVRSMEERRGESLATARFNTQLLSALGIAGLLLAVAGIYGVVAYFVNQRTQEIGVRLALGATPARVIALVVGQGMRPVLAGIVVGAGAALAVTRVLANQLYGVGASDPLTFVGVAVVVALAAVVAALLPARRAARVEPKEALGV